MPICGIYGFFQISSHKWYIGQSIDIKRREKEHRTCIDLDWHQLLLKNPNDFIFTILEECKPEELDSREAYYINYYNSYENGFNSTHGNTKETIPIKVDTNLLVTPWRGCTITDEDEQRILRSIQAETCLKTIEKILSINQIDYEKIKYDLTWKFDENHFLIRAWPFKNHTCKANERISIYLNLERNINKQRDTELEAIIKKDKINWEIDNSAYYPWYYIARKGFSYNCNKIFQLNQEYFSIHKLIDFKEKAEQMVDCIPYWLKSTD